MNIYTYYMKLPIIIKLPSYIYILSIISYNITCSYFESKIYLHKFRINNLSIEEKKNITNEWQAIRYGANINFVTRLCESIIFPIICVNYLCKIKLK